MASASDPKSESRAIFSEDDERSVHTGQSCAFSENSAACEELISAQPERVPEQTPEQPSGQVPEGGPERMSDEGPSAQDRAPSPRTPSPSAHPPRAHPLRERKEPGTNRQQTFGPPAASANLGQLIETEIIPRLMLLHAGQHGGGLAAAAPSEARERPASRGGEKPRSRAVQQTASKGSEGAQSEKAVDELEALLRQAVPRTEQGGAQSVSSAQAPGGEPGEAEIRTSKGEEAAADHPSPDVVQFARLVMDVDREPARAFLAEQVARGQDLKSICLTLFGPTARHLGALWEADWCTFAEVTLGLSAIQQLLREQSGQAHGVSTAGTFDGISDGGLEGQNHRVGDQWFRRNQLPVGALRCLLAPVPGNQHTLGITVVEAFFRDAGWDVVNGLFATASELKDRAGREWFDLVGVSVSRASDVEAVKRLLPEIRRQSCNPSVVVLLGGNGLRGDEHTAEQLGADLIAQDAQQAVYLATERLKELADGHAPTTVLTP